MGLLLNHSWEVWWLNILTLPKLTLEIVNCEQNRHFPKVKKEKNSKKKLTHELWHSRTQASDVPKYKFYVPIESLDNPPINKVIRYEWLLIIDGENFPWIPLDVVTEFLFYSVR